MSGLGVGVSILDKLIRKAKERGLPDEALHCLSTPESDSTIDELADKFVEILIVATSPMQNVVRITMDPDALLDYDKTKDNWKYLNDVKEPTGELTLELVEFLGKGETCINGEELVKRAKRKDVLLGQRHAEALLRNQNLIPEEWRNYYLVFPGSVLRSPVGRRLMPGLCWSASRWYLYFDWLGDDFGSGVRLVDSRK